MQVQVAGPAVEMIERRRDQAGHVDLRHGAALGCRAGARRRDLALHVRNHLGHRRMVRLHDALLRGRVANTPEDARRLRNRKREVIAGDGATPFLVRLFHSGCRGTRRPHRRHVLETVGTPALITRIDTVTAATSVIVTKVRALNLNAGWDSKRGPRLRLRIRAKALVVELEAHKTGLEYRRKLTRQVQCVWATP